VKSQETIGNRRILVVDDNIQIHEDFRKILTHTAESEDEFNELERDIFGTANSSSAEPLQTFELDTADQGQQGARMVRAAHASGKPYAMAFVDMRMPPGWDGLQTIEQMWKHDPYLEVVICTAYSDRSWREISDILDRPEQLLVLKKPFDSIEAKQLAASLTQKWEFSRLSRCRVEELRGTVIERTSALDLISGQSRHILEWVGQPILAIDRNGNINLANQAAAEVLGYSIGDLNGEPFHETIHPSHSNIEECCWSELSSGGALSNTQSGGVVDDVFCRGDGSWIEVELAFNESHDSSGAMNGAVVMFCGKL
jgi:PAS domain S-box-containing protein